MSFKYNVMYRFVLLKHNPQVREAPWTYDHVEPTKEVLDMVITTQQRLQGHSLSGNHS